MVKTVGIVSLSSGMLGEAFVRHELRLGIRRLEQYGLEVRFMEHAKKGIDYIREHPEKRAEDLLAAFRDPAIDMILCAIGGDDTYRLLPYLFEHDELKRAVGDKIFLGFSDSTMNHFMLNKVGLKTFYGQSFLTDVCELEPEMLPYTRQYFEELIETGGIKEISPSRVWYESRTDFGEDQTGVRLKQHPDRGFELLQGNAVFSGKILGGCLDTIFDMFDGGRYADSPKLCTRYGLFPAANINISLINLMLYILDHTKPAHHFSNPQLQNSYVAYTLNYIAEHYTEKIIQEDIASQLHISVRYLSKLFKAHIGITLSSYINVYRINHSISLMQNTKLSLTEIALQSGFTNSQHYSKVFRDCVNTTPSQYRKSI